MAIYILLFKPWYKCRWQLLPYFLILVMAIFSLNLGNVVHYKTCPENKQYKWNVFCNILHTKAITNYQLAISHIMLIKNFFVSHAIFIRHFYVIEISSNTWDHALFWSQRKIKNVLQMLIISRYEWSHLICNSMIW